MTDVRERDRRRGRRAVRTGLGLILLGPAAWVAPAAGFDPAFDTWFGFDSGFYGDAHFPYASDVADLDGDGDPDVVASHWFFPRLVSVLINHDGRYAEPVYYSIGDSSREIRLADVTGDGSPDILASNTGSSFDGGTISVLRNLGDGTFAPREDYLAAGGPLGIAPADYDGDGDVDLVVAGSGTQVALLRNDGTGAFGLRELFPAAEAPYKVTAGDLDGDGLPEVVVACENTRVAVLPNTGGTFAAPVVLDAGFGVNDLFPCVSLADLDRDGDLDIVYGSTRSQIDTDDYAVVTFRNLGGGTFAEPSFVRIVEFLAGPVEMAVTDVTGDGWVDILTVHVDTGSWTLIASDGTGGFEPGVEIPAGDSPVAIHVADVDGDLDGDVLITNRNSLEVTVHPNPGDGSFGPRPSTPVGAFHEHMDVADIDGDGDLDVATSGFYSSNGEVGILRSTGDGGLTPVEIYPAPRAALDVKLRDLNGDGRPDLLWATAPTSPPYDFHTRMNLGDGTFGPAVTWPVGTCGTGGIDAFDMDLDGDLDVFLTDYLGCAGGGESNFVYISEGNGDGTFQAPYVHETFISPEIVRGADLDADGKPDLIWTEADAIGVSMGNGDGTFGSVSRFITDWGPKDVVAGDLNGDGFPDLVTCNMAGDPQQSMCVLLGNGDGTFDTYDRYVASYSTIGGVRSIALGDADADGDLDAMLLNYGSNDVSFYRNRGDGTFEPHVRYGVGWSPTDLAFGDFTGDGVGDVVAVIGYPPSDLYRGVAIVAGTGAVTVAVDPAVGTPAFPTVASARPNPFQRATQVAFTLPSARSARITIHDVGGRRIRTLADGMLPAGPRRLRWDGRDDAGQEVAAGVYFIRLSAGEVHQQVKAIRLE